MNANACSVPPRSLFHSNLKLVNSTPVIVLAKAVAASESSSASHYEFRLETIRSLKGQAPKTFSVTGYAAGSMQNSLDDFNGHKQPQFWAFDAGNTIQRGDCVARGIFQVGENYLVFLRKASHTRSYENIRVSDDLWLQVVELLIAHEH